MLDPIGDFAYKAMFGGYGIYKDGIICALIIDNELYFKADNEAATFYKQFDSQPFTYQGKNKPVQMCYWQVPSEVLEDETMLDQWFSIAWKAAAPAKNKNSKNCSKTT